MQKCRILTAVLMVAMSLPLFAQSDDFGVDLSLEVQKKFSRKWSMSVEAEFRNRNNLKTNDRWSVGLGVDYKVAKWLKASAGYSYLYGSTDGRISYFDEYDDAVIDGDAEEGDKKYSYPSYWTSRHRFNVSLTFDKKLIGDFRFSLRERWQYTWRPEQTIQRYSYLDAADVDKTYSGKGKNVLRSRLQIEYDKKGLALKPYISAELFNAWSVEKIRYTAGLDWNITKQHSIGAFYRYQNVRSDDDEDPNIHMIGLGYKFKF